MSAILGWITAVSVAAPAIAQPAKPTGPGEMPERTVKQVEALQRIKQSQSPTQSKIDSRLLVEQLSRQNRATVADLPRLKTGVTPSDSGQVLVDIRAVKLGDALINHLRTSGAGIRAVSRRNNSVRAEMPLTAVESISRRDDVRKIELAAEAMTSQDMRDPKQPRKKESKVEKADRIKEQISQVKQHKTGPVTSEGDRVHNADTARDQFGVTGIGVKACAISDGVDSLPVSQASGELPQVDVLPGQAGFGDEGTAMLEILHDLAPGAQLGFATAVWSDASFADNIRALRFQSHCDVIVDDILYFRESPFQDWIIAQAVNDVTADGAFYFSSAGNDGNTVDGTAGHWEGDFVDSGLHIGKYGGTAHNFAGQAGLQIYEPISDYSTYSWNPVPVTLFWSDPLGGSANDYDLYLLDSQNNVVSFSQDFQTGTQDPYERLDTPTFWTGLRLAVVKYSGGDRHLSLSALRGRFNDSSGVLNAYTTPGVTRGHSAARDAFSVSAAPAAAPLPFDLEPGDPPNPSGPYPQAFDGQQKVERFTSDGPRRVFYQADGTPITPGNVSSTGGEVRQKPDLTAADGVQTSVYDYATFYGTSAAAPHAAAIAALVLSGNPGLPLAEMRDAFAATAIDIEESGVDGRAGYGIPLADRVLAHTGASPQPLVVATAPTVVSPDGDPHLRPGETGTVTLPVTNIGEAAAVSTSVVLTSPTPGVTVVPRSQFYGTVDRGQTVTNDYSLSVPSDHPPGTPVVLDAKVTYAGATSPTTASFSIPIGQPSNEVHDFAHDGPLVFIPDADPFGVNVPINVSGIGNASKVWEVGLNKAILSPSSAVRGRDTMPARI